jgi:hypothetical protein
MIDPQSQKKLQTAISHRIAQDRHLLDELRRDVRPLRDQVRQIQPRGTTALSLVATDGGNNRVQFDPFLAQLVRVVDSSNNEYYIDVVTPTTDTDELSRAQFNGQGRPQTALGEMMHYLGARHLADLSYMVPAAGSRRQVSARWVEVYRELIEWAVLLSIIRNKEFGTDTLIVFDGLLRSKVFREDLFHQYLKGIVEGVRAHLGKKRKVYLVGIAKHSKVLSRYRLTLALEQVLVTDYPAYTEIPRELEEKAYVHADYARGDDIALPTARLNRFVGGKMFFVKFGSRPHDPIWPVDIFLPQHKDAPAIFGHLLADALNGFPVPFYPLCLQRAHENAALIDFDYYLLQDHILDSIRQLLGEEAIDLDAFRLQDLDPAQERYGFE